MSARDYHRRNARARNVAPAPLSDAVAYFWEPMLRFLQNSPHTLELIYAGTAKALRPFRRVLKKGGAAERMFIIFEKWTKGDMFDCRMCGQCVLHSTGMTCPMTCPKELRNGPCGGVRPNGHCEVLPDMPCVWTQGWNRSREMPLYGDEFFHILAPVNRRLKDTSAWINHLHPETLKPPAGWEQ